MEAQVSQIIFSFYFTLSSVMLPILLFCNINPIASQIDDQFISKRCNNFYTGSSDFFSNLEVAISSLQSQLNSSSAHFATAEFGQDQGYVAARALCRNYLSTSDCLNCISTAASEIRTCSPSTNSRVYYDGCSLGYQFSNLFVTDVDGTFVVDCGNRSTAAEDPGRFKEMVDQLLKDLLTATPRIDGFFAAVKREDIVGGGGVAYGVAQCPLKVRGERCRQCLDLAYKNIESCPPIGDGKTADDGCFLRYSDTPFFRDNQTTDITSLLRKGVSSSKKVYVGIVVGGAVLILLLLSFFFYRRWQKTRKNQEDIIGATELRGPVIFQYDDLKSATRNFSEKNKLGRGGFGVVYKGVMKDGKIVAVKKLKIRESERVKEDFKFEIKLINNVHHRNLVQLLGCCSKGPELLLVYELMANNSLDKYIFGERRGSLNWKQRFEIIVGIARGLAYLHEEFHICIIHRDIKPNNILLDDEFQPKIADFGLARLLPGDKSHLNTRLAGTLGYMAPEYAIQGKLSEKVDVYSYGVVLLEIISGRKSTEIRPEPITEFLIEWAWRLYEEGSLIELVDESLDPNELMESNNEVKKATEIGLMCTQSVGSRPTMSEVVFMLLNNREQLGVTLTRPKYINSTHTVQRNVTSGELATTSGTSAPSNATASFSELQAR